jgi:hypothetical protein
LSHPTNKDHPTLTRHHRSPARFNYELHVNGALLQGGDDLGQLLKYVTDKNGTITRTKDEKLVWPLTRTHAEAP